MVFIIFAFSALRRAISCSCSLILAQAEDGIEMTDCDWSSDVCSSDLNEKHGYDKEKEPMKASGG